MGSLLTGDTLRDTLEKAHKKAWERKIADEWKILTDKFKSLSDRENNYSEEELERNAD